MTRERKEPGSGSTPSRQARRRAPSTRRAHTREGEGVTPAIQTARADRGALSTGDVRRLQRSLGNQAVRAMLGPDETSAARPGAPALAPLHVPRISRAVSQGPALIQRALPDANTYRVLDTEDARLVAIGDAVEQYNAVAGTRDSPEAFQTNFNRLQAVDRAIYTWYAQVSRDNQRLEGNPHHGTIKALMAAAEREHEELIEASKGMAEVLPMDTTGLEGPELAQLKTLWQDIVNNRGKIKLVGTEAYNKRILAELGKILSTPTGRAMLRFLNTAREGEVPESAEAELSNVYIGERRDQLPDRVQEASPQVEDAHASEAQPLNVDDSETTRKLDALTGVTRTPIDPLAPPDPVQYPAVTADNMHMVRDAAWGGLKGFTHGGKKYEFNTTGTGAFVSSFPAEAVHPGRDPGNEVMTPGWTTLGHELGHAANMKAGSSTIEFKSHFDDELVVGMAGSAEAGKKWDNAEELLNIENVENALRDESGLSEREGHQPPAWATQLAVTTRSDLRRPLNELYQADNSWYRVDEWAALDRRCRILPVKTVLDPTAVAALRGEVTVFMDRWRDETAPAALRRATIAAPLEALKAQDDQWGSNAEWKRVSKMVAELTVPDTLDVGKMDTARNEVKAFLKAQAEAKLPAYLRTISKSNSKRDTLYASLANDDERIAAFRFLHEHRGEFQQIKAMLHFNKARRQGTTEPERQQSRIDTFKALVEGRQAIG